MIRMIVKTVKSSYCRFCFYFGILMFTPPFGHTLNAQDAEATDALVFRSDTLFCKITHVNHQGVSFIFNDEERKATFNVLRSVKFRGEWIEAETLRGMQIGFANEVDSTGKSIAPSDIEFLTNRIHYLERNMVYAGRDLRNGGSCLIASLIVTILGGVATGVLASSGDPLAAPFGGVTLVAVGALNIVGASNFKRAGLTLEGQRIQR